MNKVILLTHCIRENYIVEKGDTKYACVKQEEKKWRKISDWKTRTIYKESNSEKRNILTKLKYETKMTGSLF